MDADEIWDRIKDVIFFFLPVLTVISMASFLALIMTLSQLDVQASVFVADEESGTSGQAFAGLGNALIFIIPAIVGSFVIVAAVRYGKKRLLKMVFRGLLTLTTAMIIMMFLYILSELISSVTWWTYASTIPFMGTVITVGIDSGSFLLYLVMAFIGGYVTTAVIFTRGFKRSERNGALILLSAFMGAFMAVIMPTWTILFLLIGLALWDIYAVFKGPIKDMVELDMKGNMMASLRDRIDLDPLGDKSEEFPFQNMTYDSGTWALGIGDLVFYSVLGAHSLFYSIPYVRTEGIWMMPFFFVPVLIAILAGFAYTIYRLTRSKGDSILPGLPIPMFLGVGVFVIMMIIARFVI
ncbi:MAG: hypothetical protein ACMUIG_02625 [Thermoplasmatota archaeon]